MIHDRLLSFAKHQRFVRRTEDQKRPLHDCGRASLPASRGIIRLEQSLALPESCKAIETIIPAPPTAGSAPEQTLILFESASSGERNTGVE
jgi:hypothetical protein